MAKRTIPRTCENCQTPFLAESHEINKGRARFCSRRCANQIIRRAPNYKPPTCRHCGAEITAERPKRRDRMKYCGQPCRDADLTLERRFWSKVDKTAGFGPHGDCWVWIGGTTGDGYGVINTGGRTRGAHAVSFEILNGPVPPSECVLHRCDNPPCVNPEHLFLGTQADNMRDMDEKGRRNLTAKRKLSAEQVSAIRIEYSAGRSSYSMLARKYGVSDSAINHIVNNRTWTL